MIKRWVLEKEKEKKKAKLGSKNLIAYDFAFIMALGLACIQ